MDLSTSSNLRRLKCYQHQRQIEFINLKDDSKCKLACSKCTIEYKLDYEYIIDIGQLLSEQQNTIFNNLPPGISEQLISELNSHNIQNSNKSYLIDEVEKCFEKYIEVILNAIKEHKIKIINQINIIEDSRISVTQTYNFISYKGELQKKIIECSNNPQELENYVKEMIQVKKSSLLQDKKKIEDSLQVHSNEYQKINLDRIQNNLLSILENIRSINFVQSNQINSNSLHSSSQPHPNNSIRSVSQNNQNANSSSQPTQLLIPILEQISLTSSPLIQKQIQIESISELQSTQNIQSYQNIYINLLNQSIGDNEIEQICSRLQGCQLINQLYLNLGLNEISNSGIVHLSNVLQQIKQLTHLQLNLMCNNAISELGIIELCKALQYQSHMMTYLELGLGINDNINDQVVIKYIIPLVSSYTYLSHLDLDLGGTKIGGNSVRQIANTLKSFNNLNTLILDLEQNYIKDDEGFILLSNQIQGMNQTLTKVELKLNNNHIENKVALSLLNALSTFSNLQELLLDLSDNKIEEESKKQIRQIEQTIKDKNKKLNRFKIHLN